MRLSINFHVYPPFNTNEPTTLSTFTIHGTTGTPSHLSKSLPMVHAHEWLAILCRPYSSESDSAAGYESAVSTSNPARSVSISQLGPTSEPTSKVLAGGGLSTKPFYTRIIKDSRRGLVLWHRFRPCPDRCRRKPRNWHGMENPVKEPIDLLITT